MGLTQGEEEFGCECVKPQREGLVLLSGVNMFPHRGAAVPRLLRRSCGHSESEGHCTTRLQTWHMTGKNTVSEQQATLQPPMQARQRILTLSIHSCPSVSSWLVPRTVQTSAPEKALPTYANSLVSL